MSYIGLPKFEDLTIGVKGCVVKAGLRSASDLGGGTVQGAGAGLITYSNNGVKLGKQSRVQFNTAGLIAANSLLVNTAIWGFTIDTAWLTDAYSNPDTQDEYALMCLNTFGVYVKKFAGLSGQFIAEGGATVTNNIRSRQVMKSGRSKVVVYMTQAITRIYVDGYLQGESVAAHVVSTPSWFQYMYVGGRADSLNSPFNHSVSDFFIIAGQNIVFPVLPRFRHVNVYGDSKTVLGQYMFNDANAFQVITAINNEDGIVSADFTADSTGYDANLFPGIQRGLAQRGLFVGGDRLHSWGEGGSGVIHLSAGGRSMRDRVTASLGNFPKPTAAVIDVGTNDAADGSITINAAWKTEFELSIVALISNGCTQIAVLLQPGRTDLSGSTKTTNDGKLGQINDYYKTLPGIYPQIKFVDIFTPTGGFNPPASWFVADGLHPSPAQEILKGNLVANVLV